MFNCIWCGHAVGPGSSEGIHIPFKTSSFVACSSDCKTKTLRHFACYKWAAKIWIWVVIPVLLIYVGRSISMLFQGLVPPHRINFHLAIFLILVGVQFLVFPMLPNMKEPMPVKWHNIRAATKMRITLGIAFLLLALMRYFR